MLFLRVIAWYGAEKFSLKKVVSIFTSGGDMSFVGTRPEVTKYVKKYTKEMRATLLLESRNGRNRSVTVKADQREWTLKHGVLRIILQKRTIIIGLASYSIIINL